MFFGKNFETIKSNVKIEILEKHLNVQNDKDNLIKDMIDSIDILENIFFVWKIKIQIKTFKSPHCYFEATTKRD
jgi:hypothetical protein